MELTRRQTLGLPTAAVAGTVAGSTIAGASTAQARLTDPRTAAGSTTGGPFTDPAVDPTKRIDFVTVGAGLHVPRAEVPAEQAASDHRPMVADLTFRS